MDIHQYISSGVIEACVLGSASTVEMHELRLLATQNPEIQRAWEEAQISMEEFTSLYAQDPPNQLMDQIWQLILDQKRSPQDDALLTLKPEPEKKNNILRTVLQAASILLLVGSVALNFILLRQQNLKEVKLAVLANEKQELIVKNKEYETQRNELKSNLQLLTNPQIITIPLNGVGKHEDNQAFVYWDGNSKMVYLSLKNLPAPPEGKQYQLWAIDQGQAQNAGLFPLDSSEFNIHQMVVIENAQTFALTLENIGGVAEPTLSEMYVAGNINP